MNKRTSIMLLLLIIPLLAHGINAQYSLDEMIQQVKKDQSFVFDGPQSRPTSAPVQNTPQNVPQYPAIDGGLPSLDSRFDLRVSNVISNKILDLAHKIGVQVRDQHVKSSIISPVSIAGALALVLLGANGQTFNEVMQLFGFDRESALARNPYKIHEEFGLLIEDLTSDYQTPMRSRPLNQWKYMTRSEQRRQANQNSAKPSDYHIISIANGLFIQNGFSLRPSYESAVLNVYRSELVSLDFRSNAEMAKQYINNWVDYKTHGKIKQIVGAEINGETNMIIASALYFKALWETTFIEGGTNTKNFYPDGLGTAPIPVEMMAHGGVFPFYDAKEYDCRILGFPYRGNLTTMYVILPNNSTRQRLREIQTFLTADKIEDMISKMLLKTAVILFPKLHIQNSLDLKSVFRRMGLNSLFEPTLSDLSLVSSGRVINFGASNSKRPQAASNFVQSSAGQPFTGNRMDNDQTPHPAASSLQQTSSGQQAASHVLAPNNLQAPVFQPDTSNQQATNQQQAASQQQAANQREPSMIQSAGDLQNQLIFSRFGSDDNTGSNYANEMQSDQPKTEYSRPYVPSPVPQTGYYPYQTPLPKPTGRQLGYSQYQSPYNLTQSSFGRYKRTVTYKVESNFRRDSPPLRYKDFVLSKRITKQSSDKKLLRGRRQADPSDSIKSLDALRNTPGLRNPNIFADAIVHKIDLTINEKGTEGGAATAVYLTRTGTDVVFRVETPFLLLIRHDATKIPIFYGSVYEPTDF